MQGGNDSLGYVRLGVDIARRPRKNRIPTGPHLIGPIAGVVIAGALIGSGIVNGAWSTVALGVVIAFVVVLLVGRHVLHQREWSEWHGEPDGPDGPVADVGTSPTTR
jgi:hypothetical protein